MRFFGFRIGGDRWHEHDAQPGYEAQTLSALEDTYYEVLGVSRTAAAEEIRAALRFLVLSNCGLLEEGMART